jgi:hypothetical protein
MSQNLISYRSRYTGSPLCGRCGVQEAILEHLAPRSPLMCTKIQRSYEFIKRRASRKKKMNQALDIPPLFLLGATSSCKSFEFKYLRYVYPKAHSKVRFYYSLSNKLRAMEALLGFYEHHQLKVDRTYAFAGKQKSEAAMVIW